MQGIQALLSPFFRLFLRKTFKWQSVQMLQSLFWAVPKKNLRVSLSYCQGNSQRVELAQFVQLTMHGIQVLLESLFQAAPK